MNYFHMNLINKRVFKSLNFLVIKFSAENINVYICRYLRYAMHLRIGESMNKNHSLVKDANRVL